MARPDQAILERVEEEIREFEAWMLGQREGQFEEVDEFFRPTGKIHPIPLAVPEEAILRTYLLWKAHRNEDSADSAAAETRRSADETEGS